MSDKIRQPTINPPDLDDLLDELKNDIFANLNCIEIGKVNSVNLSEQTVEVEIQFKRRVGETETKEYPLLVDVPFFILQGGGAFLELPIAEDDYCIVLFNDRCIDSWWDAGNLAEPLTTRKHDLSDGIALIGLNPKSSVLSLVGDIVKLMAEGYPFEIETDENITIKTTGTDKIILLESEGEIQIIANGTDKPITLQSAGPVSVEAGGDIDVKSTGTGKNVNVETDGDINLTSTGAAKKINLDTSAGECNINCLNVHIGGDSSLTEELLKATAMLNELIIAFNAHTHNFSGTGSVLTPTVPWIQIVNFPTAKSLFNKTS